ncbi:MAG TPA: hypothetical protein VGL66_03320 [Caulobacteraceae bacterium]|jgi:hypothetical protein
MQVVNGYICQSCSDVSLAHQGIDPAHPEDNPKSPKYDAQAAATRNDPAVRFGGALAGVEGAFNSGTNGSSTQRPPRNGDLVNVSA